MSGNNGSKKIGPRIRTFNIGDVVKRQDRSPLIVCGRKYDGKVLVRQKMESFSEIDIISLGFRRSLIKPNAIFKLQSGILIQIIRRLGTSDRWETISLDILEFYPSELIEIEAFHHVSKFDQIATSRSERGSGKFQKGRSGRGISDTTTRAEVFLRLGR